MVGGRSLGVCSKVKHDIKRAQIILDQDHYGLEEVKDRILEYWPFKSGSENLKAQYFPRWTTWG